jgi:hypothetical protein
VLPARSRFVRCSRPGSPCFPIGPKPCRFPETTQKLMTSYRYAAESLSLQSDWAKSCHRSASVQALVSMPARYSVIITAGISRFFTEIVVLLNVSEYGSHSFLERFLKVLLCHSVKHSLRFGLDLLNGIKPASFQLQFHCWLLLWSDRSYLVVHVGLMMTFISKHVAC